MSQVCGVEGLRGTSGGIMVEGGDLKVLKNDSNALGYS